MLKIGICGYGTVGQSLVDHVLSYNKKIRLNVSSDFVIARIADRSIDNKEYPKDITVTKDPLDFPTDPNIDIII